LKNKHIHLVSFDVPYPPDYGGVIDVYYKIKALHELGIKIHLHIFEYGRAQQIELQNICEQIFYYKRKLSFLQMFSIYPFIVISRKNKLLLKNLLQQPYPVVFEGLHTTYFLKQLNVNKQFTIVRTHNIEHLYYSNLSISERNIFKRFYFYLESCKLKFYEKRLRYASGIAAISPSDFNYFNSKYGKTYYIPAFHTNSKVLSKCGKGDYMLYHGNLGVQENVVALEFLFKNVIHKVDFPLIIAGKNPSNELVSYCAKSQKITLIANPEAAQMQQLVEQAHICLLPTFQNTGIKLKLLYSLFSSRYCIVNKEMIDNTGLENLCEIANTGKEFCQKISYLKDKYFGIEEIEMRKSLLDSKFSNFANAIELQKIFSFL